MNPTVAKPRAKSRRNLPPGPKGWFVFGNVPIPGADWLAGFERAARQFGDVVYFQFLHVPMILLAHPDDIESLLLTEPDNFLKSRDYRALSKILGHGLLTSEGEEWRAQRRTLQPAFRRENILGYAPVMSACAARMMDGWREGETRDLHQEMMALTVEIVAKALFGADVSGSTERIGAALETAMKQFTRIAGWAFLLPDNFPVPGTRRMRRARRELDEIIYRIIGERRTAQENLPARGSAASASAGHSSDLLGALLEIRDERGRPLNDAELRDQLMTLFLAGHETTAIALSWTWYLLATNPEAEKKLQAELDEVLRGRAPGAEDLPQLPYTEMVVKESMRLYPPAWGIGRQARQEFTAGGYTLPPRTNVFVLQWVTHRDARFFPEPERFLPERWRADSEGKDPVRAGKIPRFAYFPFGGGPRVCIGAGLALLEATLLLATIAQRFRFELAPDQTIQLFPSVTLRPKHGIRAVLRRR